MLGCEIKNKENFSFLEGTGEEGAEEHLPEPSSSSQECLQADSVSASAIEMPSTPVLNILLQPILGRFVRERVYEHAEKFTKIYEPTFLCEGNFKIVLYIPSRHHPTLLALLLLRGFSSWR